MGQKPLRGLYLYLIGTPRDAHQNLPKWISNLGGSIESRISSKTTHVVVNPKHWKKQTEEVQNALRLNREGRGLKIVSFTWVDDCCHSQGKKKEGPYLLEALDKTSVGKLAARSKKGGSSSKSDDDEEGEDNEDDEEVQEVPKSGRRMMVEVFKESTDQFVDPKERRRLERAHEKEQAILRELKENEKREKEEERKKLMVQARTFAFGSKRAREDISSDNYHIYVDSTGFYHDIVVTKVDTVVNQNERCAITIQIFETNSEPRLYAVNAKFSGTARIPSNELVCAEGTEFPAAFRAFKQIFRERTGGDWDSRISDHFDREAQAKERRRRARAAQEADEELEVQEVVPFERAKFQYHPPLYGARGVLSEKDDERMKEVRRKKLAAGRQPQQQPQQQAEASKQVASSGIDENQLFTDVVEETMAQEDPLAFDFSWPDEFLGPSSSGNGAVNENEDIIGPLDAPQIPGATSQDLGRDENAPAQEEDLNAHGLPANDANTANASEMGGEALGPEPTKPAKELNLGTCMLGKRKMQAENEEGNESKKLKHAEESTDNPDQPLESVDGMGPTEREMEPQMEAGDADEIGEDDAAE